MDTVSINTSQNVHIQFNLATVGDRIWAQMIDGIVLLLYIGAIIAIIGIFSSAFDSMPTWIPIALGCLAALPYMCFHLLFEIFDNGRSPGKRIMKIQVVNADGTEPNVGAYLIRWIFRLVDMQFFTPAVAVIAISAGGKGQRVGDMIAGTIVISHKNRDIDTIFNFQTDIEGYTPQFPGVAVITQEQMIMIRQTYAQARKFNNVQVLEKISDTITHLSNVERPVELTAYAFIEIVIRDYYYLQNKG